MSLRPYTPQVEKQKLCFNPVYFDELKDMANRSHGSVDLHLCGWRRASEEPTYRHAFSGCLMTLMM